MLKEKSPLVLFNFLFGRKKKAIITKKEKNTPLMKFGPEIYTIEDMPVSLHVYMEPRRTVRIALLKTKANLRIPHLLSSAEKERYIQWGIQWVQKKIRKEGKTFQAADKVYKDGEVLHVMGTELRIHMIKMQGLDNLYISTKGSAIFLKVPLEWEEELANESIRKAVRSMLCRKLRSSITERVLYLNEMYFGKQINSVRLKYNTSNWGSCSKKGNINISLRLLFAPPKVIDYVIIHELAHLIELNHSERFWTIVAEVDPDYKESEAWLKKHSFTSFV